MFSRQPALLSALFTLVISVLGSRGAAQTSGATTGPVSMSTGYASATSPTSRGQMQGSPGGASSNVNPFAGSVPEAKLVPEVIQLAFEDAVRRGLRQNLGALLAEQNTLSAQGQRWVALSELLPNLTTKTMESAQQESLAEFGFTIPGVPRIIGPFNYLDARAYWTQTLFNYGTIERERAARQNVKAVGHNYRDARELVVFAVGNAYLQSLAGEARVETAQAQVNTAQALFAKASDQQKAGVSPAIDTLRAQVELQSRQQQLIVARNDYAKQKLALARVIGLPLGQQFVLADKFPYEPLPVSTVEESLRKAYSSREDYQSALARVRAAELTRKAASAEYYPSLDMEADYGDIGVNPATSNGTFHVAGTLTIPIFQGGRVRGDVLQAEAAERQARSLMEDLRGQIDNEVRTALLDLAAAADQVAVARSSVELAQETLTQAQDRFAAGVTDNLEVVQAQESVASANENYISSLYAHNLAKVSYARAIGFAEQGVKQYLKGK